MLKQVFCWLIFLLPLCNSYAQVVTACPDNIGFEDGTFKNWQCYAGSISQTSNTVFIASEHPPVITLSLTGPISGRHTLVTGGVDPYGGFPLNAPNGSKYVVKLGNAVGGRGAESISYTLNVPSNVTAYSVIFNYAVVLQNPNHAPDEQPKFTAKITDLTTGSSTSCGSFEFIAASGLPGFETSTFDPTVVYKAWSPVMVNLSDYLGHTIRMEFTTNDCTHQQHFGYAYIDFNENCSIPITGNITCPQSTSLSLQVISGFAGYRWYNPVTQQEYGNTPSINLTPVPPTGTKISVDLSPYNGLGCPQTLSTEVTDIYMNVNAPPPSCLPVDLTATAVTIGNSSDLTYTYWKNLAATIQLPDPKHVAIGGPYYIKGLSSSGCSLVKPVLVTILHLSDILVTDPAPVNYPTTVNLTKTFVREAGVAYTYWKDALATVPLPDSAAIRFTGTYYIKGATAQGCTIISPVQVTVIINGIIIPNTFTPNGDGINDVFTILANDPSSIKLLTIYNRWGQKVYETVNISNYWDGMKNNNRVPAGVYYYVLQGDENKKLFKRSGYVTVIR